MPLSPKSKTSASRPYVRNGTVSRSDVWRLRRDLRDSYDKYEDDYALEPLGPFRPFGSMRAEDIEIQLHGHCSHQWAYKHWTWLHDSATDAGFHPAGGLLHPVIVIPLEQPVQLAQYAELYRGRVSVVAISRVSRTSTEWMSKWCGNQVEKCFTGQVVPPCRSSQVPQSGHSVEGSVDSMRIRE
jgi:hypothetical protein